MSDNNQDTLTLEPETEVGSANPATDEAMEALTRLATSSQYSSEEESTKRFLSEKLGLGPDTTDAIDQRIQAFQDAQSTTMSRYLHPQPSKTTTAQSLLHVLNGWNHRPSDAEANAGSFLLPEQYRKTSGGYFLNWNGKGIVINPGTHFLKNFHERGLHVQDIDYVLVTRDSSDAYAEVKTIYDLNYQLNLNGEQLHIIHYYLNPCTHRELTASLKPNFKQERNTVHCLELYVDSPDQEAIELAEGITLKYFPSSGKDAAASQYHPDNVNCLGIQLCLEKTDGPGKVTVGYVSGTAYSPILAGNLAGSDILISGFDNTHRDDYGKIQYNKDGLGYFGTFSLLEQIAPQLLLLCEYGGREGDIRMEVVKKMRQDYAYTAQQDTVILPGDTGMSIDLDNLQVACTVSQELIDPTQVRVIKNQNDFGCLQYLAPTCFI